MNAERCVTIGASGMRPNELSVLKSVCLLSDQKTRACRFAMAGAGSAADIVILDAATGAGAAALDAGARGVLWIGDERTLARPMPKQVLQRPLLASRLLGALDKLALALAHAAEAPAAAKAARNAFKPHVLVVDDSPTVRKQVELVLGGLNAQVASVASGEGALEALQRQSFDLVMLDVVLPGADGYAVCRSIKRAHATRRLPVVMLTSKSSPFDKIRGTLAGCDSYLTKPVTKEDFERAVMPFLRAGAAESAFVVAPSPQPAAG